MSRDAVPFPLPVLAVAAEDDDAALTRQCGRCRMMFAGDPTLDILVRNEWALCPSCEAILLPNRAARGNVIALRRPAATSDDV